MATHDKQRYATTTIARPRAQPLPAQLEEAVPMQRILVTPELAEDWLGRNLNNRPVSKRTIDGYARDMLAGHWHYTGDAIRFDEAGNLLDGQHRLAACVQAQASFETLVIHRLPSEVREVIDSGYKRSVRHTLHWMGYLNTTAVVAGANALHRLKNRQRTRATNSEIVATVTERHPRLVEAVARVANVDPTRKRAIGPPPGLQTAIYYVGRFLLDEPERSEQFLGVFEDGQAVYEGDPAPLWRERILRERGRGHSVSRDTHFKGLIHCWNLHSRREKLSHFKLPDDEPLILGLDYEKL